MGEYNMDIISSVIVALLVIVSIGAILAILHIHREVSDGFQDSNDSHLTFGEQKLGKFIWILWLQGFQNAPRVVHDVVESWIAWNPGWTVQLVTRANLGSFVKVPYIDMLSNVSAEASVSDVIRLALLAECGGVWADATMLCLAPLDMYIYEALEPSGFWMYHGRDACTGPASWFMISQRGSTIARKWKAACDRYWTALLADAPGKVAAGDYYWMDGVFAELYKDDDEFRWAWDVTPHLCCEDRGQSHWLAGKVADDDQEVKDVLAQVQPYALKLSRHEQCDGVGDCGNMAAAIQMAKDMKREPPHHAMRTNIEWTTLPWLKQMVVVIASYCEDIEEVLQLCTKFDVHPVMYDKCSFCSQTISSKIECHPLKNIGRDGHTFLHFVITYYDNLPYNLIFLPGNTSKHNRIGRFETLLAAPSATTSCEQESLENLDDFVLNEYEGVSLRPANVRPFRKWFEKFVGVWDTSNGKGPCWNCVMRTTRDRILQKPKAFYERILFEMSADNNMEAVHFFERSMGSIF